VRDRLRAVAYYEDPAGGPTRFSAVPPVGYAEDYTVTGMLHHEDGRTIIDSILVRDSTSGARVTIRGSSMTLEAPAELSIDNLGTLWTAGRHIAGLASKLGRKRGAVVMLEDIEQACRRLIKMDIRPGPTSLATEVPCSESTVRRRVKSAGYESVRQWLDSVEGSRF
jgi:hypothetical protein